ncbi:MAG TPA: hypothetical protein VKQ32_26735 [Polyangia bacterium]|nr:hypothetical protein [Polyangia bacterium]
MSYAKDVLRQGMPRAKVEEVLRAQGFDAAAASSIVERADKAKNERRVAGRRHMIMGAFICALGIALTAYTYSSVAEKGGSYVIWWGAIAVGAVQFFRGLIQMSDK